MNTSYLPERLVNVENSFFDQTVVEMQNEYSRWGDPGNIPQQMTDYYNRHLVMQDQFELRTDKVRDHIEYNFNLPNQVDLVLDVHPAGAGKIHISTIEPTDYPWSGVYFNGVPIKIEAIANNNYLFSNWGNNGLIANQLNAVFLDTLDVNAIQFDAYFVQDVTEVMEENEVSLFSLYPNPAKQTAYLLAKEGDHANQRYQLIDLTGRVLETKSLNKNGNETAIDLHNYPSAVYVVRILDGDQVMEQLRLVKSN